MKTFSPVAVALVSSCLVFLHSNPAFAAVIDAAGAPPEDAALAVPLELEELDDGTAAAAATSVVDATPEEAASVPNRRRRNLVAKKTGGDTDTYGFVGVTDSLPPFVFKNQCTYDITVRGVLGTGNQDCGLGGNCFTVPKKDKRTRVLPKIDGDGKTIWFSTQFYTDQEKATTGNCYGQAFCPGLEIYAKGSTLPRSIFNFDNQYSFGIPMGLSFNDYNGPIQECPEVNLDGCKQNPSLCYSTRGRSDNCYFDTTPCPPDAWKVKTHPDDPVVWCLTNDSTLGVISALQDNTPADCPSAPSDWDSLVTLKDGSPKYPPGEPLCSYNTNLYDAAREILKGPLVVDLNGDGQFTPLNRTNADIVKTARPGGARNFQAAVNSGCNQFPTQKIAGAYPYYTASFASNDRYVGYYFLRRKDHASTYEGDQTYQYHWDEMSPASDKTPMMAGNAGIQCTDNFDKVKTITVTFCPTRWEP